MTEKDLSRLVNNPRHIPGVHNYCDRWCERCPLTLRCANFALSSAMDKDAKPHDRSAESLWPRLAQLQPRADELLQIHADHPGIPQAKNPIFDSRSRPIDSHRLGAAAKRYMEFAHAFVIKNQESLPTRSPAPQGPSVTPAEAFDIINWCHLFITVKLSRALGRADIDGQIAPNPQTAPFPSDRDGSAKITLIAIDRSILAWTALSLHAPDLTPAALPAILTLHRLRTALEKHFPNARSFTRPGFDTLHFPSKSHSP